ncbi:MAG: cytochrome c [Terracidiphilus sp.]
MTKKFRTLSVLAATVCLAGSMGFGQSAGEAVYKSKCQMCHGPSGTPNPAMVKAMGVKPASDPEVKKLTTEQMIGVVKNGKGKMKPIAGLNDQQVKDAVAYFRTLK